MNKHKGHWAGDARNRKEKNEKNPKDGCVSGFQIWKEVNIKCLRDFTWLAFSETLVTLDQ